MDARQTMCVLRNRRCLSSGLKVTHIIVGLMMCAVSGCGGGQSRSVPVKHMLTWDGVYGGAYVASCRSDDLVWAARAHWIEQWRIVNGRPDRSLRLPVSQNDPRSRTVRLACGGHDVKIVTADGKSVVVNSAGRVDTSSETPMVEGRIPSRFDVTLLSKSSIDSPRLAIYRDGRGILHQNRLKDWRPVPWQIHDAVFDGQYVWAVSSRHLWRWTPGTERFVSVVLPAQMGQLPLAGIFRDGSLLWLRTRDGTGWPLQVMGSMAKLVGRPGPLPKPNRDLKLNYGQLQLYRSGVDGSLFVKATPPSQASLTLPNAAAVLPLPSGQILVSTSMTVRLLDSAQLTAPSAHTWALGEKIVRFFLVQKTVYAVGENGGFFLGRLSPVQGSRRH